MDNGGPVWDEARRAWRRIAADRARTRGERGDDGERALHTLADIGTVRRLLDSAELAAVRVARRTGRPWAEIATHLGITRQSAWERWRDLDDEPQHAIDIAAAEAVQVAGGTTASVPDVIGLNVDDAMRVIHSAGFVAAEHIPGGATAPLRPETSAVVTDQVPRGGVRRRRESTVVLWLDYGSGGAGVREPRRPKPAPREARAGG